MSKNGHPSIKKTLSCFQNIHFILDKSSSWNIRKCNSQMGLTVPPWFYKGHKIKHNITVNKKKEELSTQITEEQH